MIRETTPSCGLAKRCASANIPVALSSWVMTRSAQCDPTKFAADGAWCTFSPKQISLRSLPAKRNREQIWAGARLLRDAR